MEKLQIEQAGKFLGFSVADVMFLVKSGLLLFLSISILGHPPSSFPGKVSGQDQPERPKFYAHRVVSEKNVQNAKDSLGAPDGRYTEILPGGQLVLLMKKELYLFPVVGGDPVAGNVAQADSGSFVAKGGADIGLEVWSPWEDEENKQHHDWMAVGLSATGFILPMFYAFKGRTTGVNMIRITNPGTKSLFVDAVIGYDMEAEKESAAYKTRMYCAFSGKSLALMETLALGLTLKDFLQPKKGPISKTWPPGDQDSGPANESVSRPLGSLPVPLARRSLRRSQPRSQGDPGTAPWPVC